MPLELTPDHVRAIERHGELTYPHECCGFLLGRAEAGARRVAEVLQVENARESESRHNRYLITPEDFLRAEQAARARKLDVVGFYHSHPDVEARPSAFDTEHAWPWYAYVIVSVQQGRADHVRAWLLRDDRSQFDEEPLIVGPRTDPPSRERFGEASAKG